MTAVHRRTAERVASGSGTLLRRFGRWLLPGRAGSALRRLLAAAAGAWIAVRVLGSTPHLAWPLAAWWLAAAWRTARDAERQEQAEAAFVQLLADAIGDRNGVHLVDVLALLHRDGLLTDWSVSDVRAQCETLGIRVRDSIKVSGKVSPGVHTDDLRCVWEVHATPPPSPTGSPSPAGVTCENYPTTSGRVVIGEGAWIVYPKRAEHDA